MAVTPRDISTKVGRHTATVNSDDLVYPARKQISDLVASKPQEILFSEMVWKLTQNI